MSMNVNGIDKDNYAPIKPVTLNEVKRKKQPNSIHNIDGQSLGYMPLGGIGSLLNGKGTVQTSQAAAQV